jgi:PncC family amidohydrolase
MGKGFCRTIPALLRNSRMPDQPLEILVGELLRRRGLRLAVAESCTGGLIGHRLTNIAGSSTYYMGSVTAYAYEAKVRLLGVTWETLEKYGAVSRETVLEMARGVRHALAADIGLAVSGIAGPGGGTPEKPVGLTWIGLSAPHVHFARQFIWGGDRLQNKETSAEAALQMLADYLQGHPDSEA